MANEKINIELNVSYDSIEEKERKIKTIIDFLQNTANSKELDYKILTKVSMLLKDNVSKKYIIGSILVGTMILLGIVNAFIGIGFENGKITTQKYLGQKNAVGIYLDEKNNSKYGEFRIMYCGENSCIIKTKDNYETMAFKLLIDYYY